MRQLLQDVRFGLRMLAKDPGFAVVAVLILAGGIGVSTTIFSLVNALLFSPLPYKNPDRLVYVWETYQRMRTAQTVSYPNFLDWKNQNQVLEDLALFGGEAMTLTGAGEPERLPGVRVSPDLIRLLGAQMALGRPFLSEEYAPGKNRVVLLSHGLWQRRFGSSPEVIGQNLALNSEPHTVVGVLAAPSKLAPIVGFEPELLLPLDLGSAPNRGSRSFLAMAHLKPGVTLERAQADLRLIARRLEQQYPDSNSGWTVEVAPLRGVEPIAYVFLVLTVGSILGIVCLNLANLLLARTVRRDKESAIRAALGATRWRIVRQSLTETFLLSALGGGIGVVLAAWACSMITALSAGTNLGIVDIRIDVQVLAATLLITLLAGLATGLVPALQISRVNLNQALKEGSEGRPETSHKARLKSALVVSEVTLSLVLLNGAGLALKSLWRLLRVDPGFVPQKVLTMGISVSNKVYAQEHQRVAFFQELLSRLATRSGVSSVAVASALPTEGPIHSFTIGGRPKPPAGEERMARFTAISPQYLRTLTIPLKAGRSFAAEDIANALPVAIINETLARKYWSGGNPLGTQINVAGITRTVVGVVADVRHAPLRLVPVPEIYVPHAQSPGGEMSLLVQTTLDNPLNLAAAVKKEIQTLNPDQPVTHIQTMEKALSRDLGVIRIGTSLLGGVALGALCLAGIGIYGVLAYSVSQRTREFGIRMALGARSGAVLKLVLRQGLTPVLLGVLPGLAAALALGRLLASRIYGLSSTEPFILAGGSLLLVAVASLACYIPARRATKVDPMEALRYE